MTRWIFASLVLAVMTLCTLSVHAHADYPHNRPIADPDSRVTLTAAATSIPLHGHLSQYLDDQKQLDIAAIRQLPETAFAPLDGIVNVGYRNTVLWLRVTLQRNVDAPKIWWLVVGPAYLDRVSLFPARAEQGEGTEIAIVGNWAEREILARSAVFPIDMNNRREQTFFLRVENATALQAAPVLWQPAAYQHHSVLMALLHGGAFVTALVIVLINLFYWQTIRQPIYLWYVAFVASGAFTLLQTEGYLPLLLQPDQHFPAKIVLGLSQLLMILSFFGLFVVFVKPQRYWPASCRVAHWITFSMAVIVTLLLLTRQTASAMQIEWGYVFCLFTATMVGSSWLALRGDQRAIRYLLCFSVLILLIVFHSLELFGLISLNLDFSSLFFVACLIHWVLLQLVVIDEINSIRRAHEAACDQALAQALAMEKELELRVIQRTAELEEAGQQLQLALEDEKETNVAHHQFLRLVSHEFSTPLSVIAGSTEMLAERGDDPLLRERVIQRIQNSTSKMNELVERALQIDRTEGAFWRANAQDVRLDALINQLIQDCQNSGQECDSERIRLDCPAIELRADPDLLRIAVQNLLLNALTYSPPQTPVELRVVPGAEVIKIHVRDQGEGIPLAQQKAIFGKYYRRHSGGRGLGLGLYLVDHIMRLHGGWVELVSNPGQGSCFTLHLPSNPVGTHD